MSTCTRIGMGMGLYCMALCVGMWSYYIDMIMSQYFRSTMEWSAHSFSDCIAILNAFKAWSTEKETLLKSSAVSLQCSHSFISSLSPSSPLPLPLPLLSPSRERHNGAGGTISVRVCYTRLVTSLNIHSLLLNIYTTKGHGTV